MPERIHQKFGDETVVAQIQSNGYTAHVNGVADKTGPHQPVQGQKRKRERIRSPDGQSAQGWRTLAKNQTTQTRQPEIRGDKVGHSQLKERARVLFNVRKTLPIWSHVDEIKAGLRSKDVLLLVGETGSGKSTQVPQILVNEEWCKSRTVNVAHPDRKATEEIAVGGCIAITEPRRVAAISLARRVAEEMGTPLGSSSPASKVGYSVRFDNSTSPSTRIKFLTEGMLLQEMLRDPWLRQYSAVIVDEVHERGVNVDLVMGFLRHMVFGNNEGRGGVPLKVAVMSATADMEGLLKFFAEDLKLSNSSNGTEMNVDSALKPKTSRPDAEAQSSDLDESEWSGISSDDDSPLSIHQGDASNGILQSKDRIRSGPTTKPGGGKEPGQKRNQVSICHIEGRQYPVQISYAAEPVQDFVDAALRTIFQIHYKEPMPGDVLVFLTGQETVEALEKLVQDYAQGMGPDVPKVRMFG